MFSMVVSTSNITILSCILFIGAFVYSFLHLQGISQHVASFAEKWCYALLVPFTTGVDKVGEAVAAAAARALERREVAVLVGGVLISVSSIVAGLGGILYWVGVMPKRSSIMRNWVSASLHSRCLIFISSVCPCCSCSC